jgi:hypothetical protein
MSIIDDVIGGEVDSVVNAVKSVVSPRPASSVRSGDAFTHHVLAAIPGAINRAKEQYDQIQAPQSTSLSTPFTVLKLDLRSTALYDGKGITQKVQGRSLLYRRQGSNYTGALMLTFPTGEVNIIRPGTVLKLRFDTMNIQALSTQFEAAEWLGDSQDVYANLLAFNEDTAALFEPSFDLPSAYSWRQLTQNASGNGLYLTRGLEEIVFQLSFDSGGLAPNTITLDFFSATSVGAGGSIVRIPGFSTVVNGNGSFEYYVPVSTSGFQSLGCDVTVDQGTLLGKTVYAVK